MGYSYINSREKSAFTPRVQMLFIVFDAVILLLFGMYLFFIYQDSKFSQQMQDIKNNTIKVQNDISDLSEKIKKVKEKELFCEKIYTKNTLLKDSTKNIFELFPKEIILSKVILSDDTLILHGKTPNKQLYNTKLQIPLHSIYSINKTTLKPLDNGWYEFSSINESKKR